MLIMKAASVAAAQLINKRVGKWLVPPLTSSATSATVRREVEKQPSFEISFALWGMIVCAIVEADQVLRALF
jgi:hypothetical protein